MVIKNNMRPAYAVAGTSENRTSRAIDSPFIFNASNTDTDEFNEFNSYNTSGRQASYRRAPKQKRRSSRGNPSLIVAVIAIVAVLLLSLVLVVATSNSGGGIKYSDNAYITYNDADGNYYIAVNGNLLDASFEGTVTLHEAKDRSFAYIEEAYAGGYNIYILDDKDMISVTMSPATDILAYAEYIPAIVYEDNGDVYLYTKEHGEELITEDATASNFKISGDGTTVAYNVIDVENGNKIHLSVFTAGESSERATAACYPAAISYDGSYIYCYGYTKVDGQKKLYVLDTTDDYSMTPVGTGVFGGITTMNAKGDEIIYYTTANGENTSHIYSVRKDEVYTIAKGFFVPSVIDSDIACPSSFRKTYIQSASSESEGSTYYIDKKFSPVKIATHVGSFAPNGDYFYYINSESTLIQIDLNDDNYAFTRVLSNVVDYKITQKNNLYILDSDNVLRFHDVRDNKKTKISQAAVEISMYDHSNILYFVESDSVAVYSSKEGSSKDSVKFDKAAISALPRFKYLNTAKTYSFIYDEDIGWKLFYSSNGRKFKTLSAECTNIDGGIYE